MHISNTLKMIIFPIVPVIAYVSAKYCFKMQQKVSQLTLQKNVLPEESCNLEIKTPSLHDIIMYSIWCTRGASFLGGSIGPFEC